MSQQTKQTILFSCGGTGGHVYPALAIADSIQKQGHFHIVFAGRSDSMEERLVSAAWPFESIEAVPLVRGSILQNLLLPYKLIRSILSARKVIQKLSPRFVVATGGYVSLPIQIAAGWAGIPVFLQEQNAVAGVANKVGSRYAKRIYVTSEDAAKSFPKGKCSIQGNPVRPLPKAGSFAVPKEFAEAKFRVLVLGGSQGARGINRKIANSLERIAKRPDIAVVWQAGIKNIDSISQEYKMPQNVTLAGFLDPVYAYIDSADLLISRSGASTLAELLAFGKPSVLLPFPFATANHQEHNARVVEKAGAAWVELDDEADDLWNKVERLSANTTLLKQMADAAKQMGVPDAADRIAHDILQLENLK